MKTKSLLAAAAIATLALSVPAQAQNYPVKSGEYVEVSEISIDDGHGLDYANFLAGQWKSQEEFAKAQGWISSYEILANVHKRAGEPDLYLVVRYKSLPDAAETAKREDIMRAQMKQTDAQMEAGSADRAKYRHQMGSQLLQVLTIK